MRSVASLLAIAPLAALAGASYDLNSFGGSPTPIGAGARALGMGGAFVAVADDATANTWNPAGMTQLERPEAEVTGGYAWRRSSSDAGDDTREEFAVDHLSVVLPFHLGCQQTIGLAWQRQFDFTKGQAFSTVESAVSTTRSYDIDQEGSFATLGLSYAIEPVPGLALGITFFDWDDQHTRGSTYRVRRQERAVTDFDFGIDPSIDPEYRQTTTTSSRDEVSVDRGLSTVLGAWWQATPRLTIGVNVKPGYDLHLVRSMSARSSLVEEDFVAGTTTETTSDSSERTESTLSLPTSATLAGAVRFGDFTTLSTDLTWTRWREYRSSQGGTETSPLAATVSPDAYRDGWTVRVGLEHVIPLTGWMLVPRCGALYEQVPGISAASDPSAPGDVRGRMDEYVGATLGASVLREALIVDIGAQVRQGSGIAGEGAPPDQESTVRTVAGRISIAYLF
jgi:long-subunit fatty acid transport protein